MSDKNVKEIEDLIKIISRLPGLGPKSAKRIVLKLIKNREELKECIKAEQINKLSRDQIEEIDSLKFFTDEK